MKKISVLVTAIVMTIGLTGCMSSGAKLPEGDVKVASQQVQGVVDLLLQSADYGKDMSSVCSILLPEGSQYDVKLYMDNYKDGKLEDTIDLADYTTNVVEKNSIIQVIMNVGKYTSDNNSKSIYSISEVDKENTEDEKNPQYSTKKFYGDPVIYDGKSEITQVGTDLDKDIVLASYVKFKDGDAEKKVMDLTNFDEAQLSNYQEAHIIKMKVTKK